MGKIDPGRFLPPDIVVRDPLFRGRNHSKITSFPHCSIPGVAQENHDLSRNFCRFHRALSTAPLKTAHADHSSLKGTADVAFKEVRTSLNATSAVPFKEEWSACAVFSGAVERARWKRQKFLERSWFS